MARACMSWVLVAATACSSTRVTPPPPAVEIQATTADAQALAPPPPRPPTRASAPKPRWPPAASELEAKQLAKEAYKEGLRGFRESRYDEAVVSFERADFYYPGAAPKLRIAECYDRLGNVQQAIRAYNRFVASEPSERYADKVSLARRRIRALRRGGASPSPP